MAFDPSQQHTNELQRDGTPSAAIITVSDTTPISEDACSQRQMQPIPEKLGLLQRVDWDEEKAKTHQAVFTTLLSGRLL